MGSLRNHFASIRWRVARVLISNALRVYTVLLILVHGGLVGWCACNWSPTWDEPGHWVAGISHWRTGSFDLYRVNPPLVRLIAAAPALWRRSEVNWVAFTDDPRLRAEESIGARFLREQGIHAVRDIQCGRLMLIPVGLVGIVVVMRWSYEMYGVVASAVAGSLFALSPEMIAHGSLITADSTAAVAAICTYYAQWKWLRSPTCVRALCFALCLGTALATKFTLFVLLPVSIVATIGWILYTRASRLQAVRRLAENIGVIVLAFVILNAVYGFEGSGLPLRDVQFISERFSGEVVKDPWRDPASNRFQGTFLGKMPIPVPKNVLMGIDHQQWDFERSRWSYLNGEWRFGAWPHFFIYAALVKSPICAIGAVGFALFSGIVSVRRFERSAVARDLLLMLPPGVIIATVSSSAGFSDHGRYILPAAPFLFVWVGRSFQRCRTFWSPIGALALALIVAAGVESGIAFPHYLSYANCLAGGPEMTYRHLLGSSTDWGQDNLYLRKWIEAHPEARPMSVAILPSYLAAASLGIDAVDLESSEEAPRNRRGVHEFSSGWYAISVNLIYDREKRYHGFQDLAPAEYIGGSIRIYRIPEQSMDVIRHDVQRDDVGSEVSDGRRSRPL